MRSACTAMILLSHGARFAPEPIAHHNRSAQCPRRRAGRILSFRAPPRKRKGLVVARAPVPKSVRRACPLLAPRAFAHARAKGAPRCRTGSNEGQPLRIGTNFIARRKG